MGAEQVRVYEPIWPNVSLWGVENADVFVVGTQSSWRSPVSPTLNAHCSVPFLFLGCLRQVRCKDMEGSHVGRHVEEVYSLPWVRRL